MKGQGVEARLLAPTLSHITINAGQVLTVLLKATQNTSLQLIKEKETTPDHFAWKFNMSQWGLQNKEQ